MLTSRRDGTIEASVDGGPVLRGRVAAERARGMIGLSLRLATASSAR
jgi:hypothetical protein